MPALVASLEGEEGRAIKEHLIKYVRAEEGGGEGEQGEKEAGGDSSTPQQRVGGLQQTLIRLKELQAEAEEERGKEVVVQFLEDLLKSCEEP